MDVRNARSSSSKMRARSGNDSAMPPIGSPSTTSGIAATASWDMDSWNRRRCG